MVNGKKCVFIQPVRLRDWRYSWGLLYMYNVLAMGRGGGASFSGRFKFTLVHENREMDECDHIQVASLPTINVCQYCPGVLIWTRLK